MGGGSLDSLHGCCFIKPWKHAYWTLIWAKKAYFSMVRARKAKIVYTTPRLGLRLLKMAHICHSIFLKRTVCPSPTSCEGSKRQFLDFWILAIFLHEKIFFTLFLKNAYFDPFLPLFWAPFWKIFKVKYRPWKWIGCHSRAYDEP
jgi:hypothetical protein